ncbi:hypothetical protein BKA59DRAFT_481793 [Fusarium tricinctum]|uniref:Uncharacterized protein n=1 Tax=Fusarium tricinctum TaxID=61284 RepID=A0A8K0RR44_9HYPO|nr:hypothetical protein BKA59DRAFT_481793 [Fusarium tricinctum]
MCSSLGDFLSFSFLTPTAAHLFRRIRFCCGLQSDGPHSQQMPSMHEGVIRDLPALPAPSRHRRLVIPQPHFTAYYTRVRC